MGSKIPYRKRDWIAGVAPRPTIDRLLDLLEPDLFGGCWLFAGTTGRDGSGRILANYPDRKSRMVLAHRVAFEELVRPLADGERVAQTCRVKVCCNPAHLVPFVQRLGIPRIGAGRPFAGTTAADRLSAKLKINFETRCLEFQGTLDAAGYGEIVGSDGAPTRAHILAFELANGRKPLPGLFVLHSCDNPPCCNPDHLFEGTQLENVRDMIRKGRAGYQKPRR